MLIDDLCAQQDVVYFFAPEQAARITVSLCPSSAFSDAFDTKLYILGDLLRPQAGQVSPLACNDDFCGSQSQITVSPQPCTAHCTAQHSTVSDSTIVVDSTIAAQQHSTPQHLRCSLSASVQVCLSL